MRALSYDSVNVGDELPALNCPPISRLMLTLYAVASGDHNPVHVDPEYARTTGMRDVFAHGMLSMAWLGRLITQWVPQAQLRQFSVRFQGITHLGDQITCRGRVVDKWEKNGERKIVLEISTGNQFGHPKVTGMAIVDLH